MSGFAEEIDPAEIIAAKVSAKAIQSEFQLVSKPAIGQAPIIATAADGTRPRPLLDERKLT